MKKDHNMWAYIYYSIYLDEIDSTNHNAIEKYVYDKVRKEPLKNGHIGASHFPLLEIKML